MNNYDGIKHDFTRKRGIVHTTILLPDQAPAEFKDRSVLWNAVEQIEKAKNSQLAREIEVSLPRELNTSQQTTLVKEYCQKNFVSKGMCADICIHDKQDGNPHAHIMLTMRPLNYNGTWGAKAKKEYILNENGEKIRTRNGHYKSRKINTTDWNERERAEEWRSSWADIVNSYLAKAELPERIDHRSYKRQGIEKIPTVHVGISATQMERRGIITRLGNLNRQIAADNKLLAQMKEKISALRKWIKDILTKTNKSTQPMYEFNQSHQLPLLSEAATTYLESHQIECMEQLENHITALRAEYDELVTQLKQIEKESSKLEELYEISQQYLKYKQVYQQYQATRTRRKAQFYDSHTSELILFDSAERYLKEHIGKDSKLTPKVWKKKISYLSSQKDALYQKIHKLKATVQTVEKIKQQIDKSIYNEIQNKERPFRSSVER